MKPQEIEDLSFKMIEQEAGEHDFNDEQWPIVRRVIHTSADFEYLKTIQFYPGAVQKGIQAIQRGCNIITDTNMARVGIRKMEIGKFGCEISCFMTDREVAKKAQDSGTTRADAAVDMACELMKDGIYVVGNAPTALLRLIQLIKDGKAEPALVIGFPVGFVNAAESKDELMKLDFPYISNKGRKGGSNIVVSIINALSIMAAESK